MQNRNTFGTTVNCMDGRSIKATWEWMTERYGVEFVDTITDPGMDGLLAGNLSEEAQAALKTKIEISLKHHGSRVITVVGHAECAGNPVDRVHHEEDVRKGVGLVQAIVKSILPDEVVQVVGLYALSDPEWHVEPVE